MRCIQCSLVYICHSLTSKRDVESGDSRRDGDDDDDTEERLAVSETSELMEALPSS